MKLTTQNWANEIKWKIGSCMSNRNYEGRKIYRKQCCLPNGIYKLTCKDDWGDGWNGGYLDINGQRFCDNFNSHKHEEDITIGSSLVPPTPPSSNVILIKSRFFHQNTNHILKLARSKLYNF